MLYFTSGSTGRPKAVVHRYLQTISGFGVTHALMVPRLIQAMLTEQAASGVGAPQLRQIAYGASPITSSLLKVAMERFSCSFIQCYGSTEAGGVPTMLSAGDHQLSGPHAGRMASAGFPLPGIAARAVQPGTNHSCSPGQTGELCFQTPIVMSRYLHDPAATAAVLDTDGWLHSRDLGYLDEDGYVYVVGRLDDVIITGRPVGDGCGLRDLGARCAVWGQAVVAAVVRSDLSLLRQCSSTAGPASLTTNARAGWSSWTSCREMRQGR